MGGEGRLSGRLGYLRLESRGTCAVASGEGMKFGEWLVHLVTGDFVVVDVEAFEDGLVELATDCRAGVPVERPGVLQQLEAVIDERGSVFELLISNGFLVSEALALLFDRLAPGAVMRARWELASPAAAARGDLGNRRLHHRWVRFNDRGKRPVVANVAVARELAGWCWSLAVLNE